MGGEGYFCGACGIYFKTNEDFEKHLFKCRGHRFCGVKVLRVIEQNQKLAEEVLEARMKYSGRMGTGEEIWELSDAQLERLYDAADKVVERYCTDCSFKGKVCQYFFRTVCPLVSRKLRGLMEDCNKRLRRGGDERCAVCRR